MKIVGMVCVKVGLFSDLKILNYLIEQYLRFQSFPMLISKMIIIFKKAHLTVVIGD